MSAIRKRRRSSWNNFNCCDGIRLRHNGCGPASSGGRAWPPYGGLIESRALRVRMFTLLNTCSLTTPASFSKRAFLKRSRHRMPEGPSVALRFLRVLQKRTPNCQNFFPTILIPPVVLLTAISVPIFYSLPPECPACLSASVLVFFCACQRQQQNVHLIILIIPMECFV
jgi:hypothetical protein